MRNRIISDLGLRIADFRFVEGAVHLICLNPQFEIRNSKFSERNTYGLQDLEQNCFGLFAAPHCR